DQDGHTYLMSIRPYRTTENRIDGAVMTLYDITERRQTAEVRYRRLFGAAKDAILVVENGSGEILGANPFFTKLFGYSRTELLGSRFSETPLFQGTGFTPASLPHREDVDSIQRTLALRNRAGAAINVEIIANAYLEGQKEVVQLNIRDVGPRVRAEEKL